MIVIPLFVCACSSIWFLFPSFFFLSFPLFFPSFLLLLSPPFGFSFPLPLVILNSPPPPRKYRPGGSSLGFGSAKLPIAQSATCQSCILLHSFLILFSILRIDHHYLPFLLLSLSISSSSVSSFDRISPPSKPRHLPSPRSALTFRSRGLFVVTVTLFAPFARPRPLLARFHWGPFPFSYFFLPFFSSTLFSSFLLKSCLFSAPFGPEPIPVRLRDSFKLLFALANKHPLAQYRTLLDIFIFHFSILWLLAICVSPTNDPPNSHSASGIFGARQFPSDRMS